MDPVLGPHVVSRSLHLSAWRCGQDEGTTFLGDDVVEPAPDLVADHDQVIGSFDDRRLESLEHVAEPSRLRAADEVVHRQHRRGAFVDGEGDPRCLQSVHVQHVELARDGRQAAPGRPICVGLPL
jgi:hypothetical protein